jgi:hypothetical protein
LSLAIQMNRPPIGFRFCQASMPRNSILIFPFDPRKAISQTCLGILADPQGKIASRLQSAPSFHHSVSGRAPNATVPLVSGRFRKQSLSFPLSEDPYPWTIIFCVVKRLRKLPNIERQEHRPGEGGWGRHCLCCVADVAGIRLIRGVRSEYEVRRPKT